MNTNLAAMSREELEAMVLRMQARQQSRLTPKVSSKGALSLYGMGRFPVTLYREQWERLIEYGPKILDFIADNAAQLKTKDDTE